MPGLHITLEESADESVTLRLEGSFDRSTAAELRRSLEALGAKRVVLDFSQVRTFVDVAVGVLTAGLQPRHVQLRGLGGHPERMFRYFGVGSATPLPPARPYYRAEDVLTG